MRTSRMGRFAFLTLYGCEQEWGRENTWSPVKEGMGKPWVSQRFAVLLGEQNYYATITVN